MGPLSRPQRASDLSWAALTGSNALSTWAAQVLAVPGMTCSWPRRPLRVAGGHEEALPVDGRAGVTARIVADTHVALVQLHCDVVIVPVVQQDPIVLCRGDLMGNGFSLPPRPMWQHRLVGGADGELTRKRCCVQNCPLLPAQVTCPGKKGHGLTKAVSPHALPAPIQILSIDSVARAGQQRPGNYVPVGAGKSPLDHLP